MHLCTNFVQLAFVLLGLLVNYLLGLLQLALKIDDGRFFIFFHLLDYRLQADVFLLKLFHVRIEVVDFQDQAVNLRRLLLLILDLHLDKFFCLLIKFLLFGFILISQLILLGLLGRQRESKLAKLVLDI